jgi:hypothetical protein
VTLNSDRFKAYIVPLIDDAVSRLGGGSMVRQLIDQLPEPTIYLVAGSVITLATMAEAAWPWRGPGASASRVFSHEEIRRTLDLVRLCLETGSSTS